MTIPPAMRKKHGLLPKCAVNFVDQPNGVLIVKAGKTTSRGKRAVAALLRGGKVNGNTQDWLRATRGEA